MLSLRKQYLRHVAGMGVFSVRHLPRAQWTHRVRLAWKRGVRGPMFVRPRLIASCHRSREARKTKASCSLSCTPEDRPAPRIDEQMDMVHVPFRYQPSSQHDSLVRVRRHQRPTCMGAPWEWCYPKAMSVTVYGQLKGDTPLCACSVGCDETSAVGYVSLQLTGELCSSAT